MKRKMIFAILLILVLLAGCGAKSGGDSTVRNEAAGAAPEYGMAEDVKTDSMGRAPSSTGTTTSEARKWIITAEMSVETEDLEVTLTQIGEKIRSLSGYVEDQNVYNGSTYRGDRYRSATLTVRIPADKADAFTEEVSGIAHVISKSQSMDDVTLTYIATESRMNALLGEEARLLELMEQAKDMTDLLKIEARLTEVRYELERITSQLRVLQNQVDYATIRLSLEEVQVFTPTEEKTVWQQISGGFMDSLKGIGNGILAFVIWFLSNIPALVLWGGLITGLYFLIRKILKKRS